MYFSTFKSSSCTTKKYMLSFLVAHTFDAASYVIKSDAGLQALKNY